MWVLARTTAALVSDPAWHGATGTGLPLAAELFTVGTPSGATVHEGRWISVLVGWVDAEGNPVAIKGTCTVEPVQVSELPMPGHSPRQIQRVASVGTAVVDVGAWNPKPLEVLPRGLWTVRLSGMAASGAARAAVWYWQAPPH